MKLEAGQLRRWRDDPGIPGRDYSQAFLVIGPWSHSFGTWWVLEDGRVDWELDNDIIDNSDVIEEM